MKLYVDSNPEYYITVYIYHVCCCYYYCMFCLCRQCKARVIISICQASYAMHYLAYLGTKIRSHPQQCRMDIQDKLMQVMLSYRSPSTPHHLPQWNFHHYQKQPQLEGQHWQVPMQQVNNHMAHNSSSHSRRSNSSDNNHISRRTHNTASSISSTSTRLSRRVIPLQDSLHSPSCPLMGTASRQLLLPRASTPHNALGIGKRAMLKKKTVPYLCKTLV